MTPFELRTTVPELAVTTGAWQIPKMLDVVVTEPAQLVLHFKFQLLTGAADVPAVEETYCPAATVVNEKAGCGFVDPTETIVISVAAELSVAFWTVQPDKTIEVAAGAVFAAKNLAVIKS